MSTPTAHVELVTFLIGQHRGVDQMFVQLEKLTGSATEEAEQLARQVVARLVQHSVAEEIHLYPLVRRSLPDVDALADREIAEHDEAEQTMKRLESLQPDNAEFWRVLHLLIRDVRQHVDEEEFVLFPQLRELCSGAELREIGRKVAQSEKTAPTRPHPASPSEGGPLAALAPGAGLVDRIRDAATGRGR
jgi:hemerythrin-like domain-containing protein